VRLHRQYVMPNGKRHDYDFYMICFGPMPLAQRAALAEAALAAFGADGAYARKQKSEVRNLANRTETMRPTLLMPDH
jgi:hypothetical protein